MTLVFYNVHRWYEQGTGRYTRPDPLGLEGGSHLFAYSLSNPLTVSDPLGMQAEAGVIELGCNLLRSRNNVGFVAGILVIVVGAALSQPCGSGSQTCGECSPPEHAYLQLLVNVFCKSGKRRCHPGKDFVTLSQNHHKNLQCAIARDRINKRCFAGGDEGHQIAAAQEWQAVSNCEELLRAEGRRFMGASGGR